MVPKWFTWNMCWFLSSLPEIELVPKRFAGIGEVPERFAGIELVPIIKRFVGVGLVSER